LPVWKAGWDGTVEARYRAKEFCRGYRSNDPFPGIVICNKLVPGEI
jgi:hypothetical protein